MRFCPNNNNNNNNNSITTTTTVTCRGVMGERIIVLPEFLELDMIVKTSYFIYKRYKNF